MAKETENAAIVLPKSFLAALFAEREPGASAMLTALSLGMGDPKKIF